MRRPFLHIAIGSFRWSRWQTAAHDSHLQCQSTCICSAARGFIALQLQHFKQQRQNRPIIFNVAVSVQCLSTSQKRQSMLFTQSCSSPLRQPPASTDCST